MISRKHPITNLAAMLRQHRVYSIKNLPRISAFYLKLLIEEPFRILENIKHGSRIKNHTLQKDPIFIIGHWRSGTSFLQYLMAQDPQLEYMNKFQVVFPDIFLQSETLFKKLVALLPQSLGITQDAKDISINLDLNSPSEIEIALTTMISSASLHWGHIFPKQGRHYFNKYLFFDNASNAEKTKWKHDYSYLINKTSLKNKGRQLLIKSPGNSCRIPQLLELYPKAKFIFIHRNPYDVFYSSQKLWKTLLNNLALQELSHESMENEIIYIYGKLMGYYIQQRKLLPKDQLVEIRFEDFITDPVKELNRTYNTLNLGGFKQAKPAFDHFLSTNTKGKSSNYKYENHNIKRLNTEWKFAFKEWGYPVIHDKEKY